MTVVIESQRVFADCLFYRLPQSLSQLIVALGFVRRAKGTTATAIPYILVRLLNTCWFVVIFECYSSQTVDQANGTSVMCTGDMFILLLLHPNIHRKTS